MRRQSIHVNEGNRDTGEECCQREPVVVPKVELLPVLGYEAYQNENRGYYAEDV